MIQGKTSIGQVNKRFWASLWCLLQLNVLSMAQVGDPISAAINRVKANVVAINTEYASAGEDPETGFGFITGESADYYYIATAAHVIFGRDMDKKPKWINVRFEHDARSTRSNLIAHWPNDDLALIAMPKTRLVSWLPLCADYTPSAPMKVRFIGINQGGPRWLDRGLDGNVFEVQSNEIHFAMGGTISPGTSGAPLISGAGIVGMIVNDEQTSSTALRLTRIRELFRSMKATHPDCYNLSSNIPGPMDDFDNPQDTIYFAEPQMKNFVFIRGGTFYMGCTSEQVLCDERQELPIQRVTLSAYYISKYELTFREYDAFCRATNRRPNDMHWGRGNRPAIQVSWLDAVEYCNWLSVQHKLEPCYTIDKNIVTCNWAANGYRLPTEAEWEYAARAGNNNEQYAGTQQDADLARYGNFCDQRCEESWRRTDRNDGFAYTAEVGSFRPNAFGLYDMSGNVWEWCWDLYGFYSGGALTDPRGAQFVADRVYRGGSWFDLPERLRVACRNKALQNYRSDNLGFRLARKAESIRGN